LVDLRKKIGDKYNAAPGEVAIAWTLLNPAVTGAIVGLRHLDQVSGVINAVNLNISQNDQGEINEFLGENP